MTHARDNLIKIVRTHCAMTGEVTAIEGVPQLEPAMPLAFGRALIWASYNDIDGRAACASSGVVAEGGAMAPETEFCNRHGWLQTSGSLRRHEVPPMR
jgi:hypothetical protein